MIDQLAVGPRAAGQKGVELVFGNLLQVAAGGVQVLQNLVLHFLGTEHLMAVIVEAGDLGDVAEHGAVGPLITLGDDRHHAHAQGFQFLETVFVVDDVDGHEGHAVFEQEFLAFQTAGTAGLPVDLDGKGLALGQGFGLGHVVSSVRSGFSGSFVYKMSLREGGVNNRRETGEIVR